MDQSAMINSEAARLHERMGRVSGLAYLQRARKRIEFYQYWIQGTDSADNKGTPCKGPAAHRFSILGALQREYDGSPEFQSAMAALREVTGGNPQKWNDRFWRSHKAVLEAFDKAMGIELAKR